MSGGLGPPSYYRPGGYSAPPPGRYRWAVLGVVVALVVVTVIVVLLVLLGGAPSPEGSGYPARYGLFGGAFFLFFLLLDVFFVVRVVFWGTRMSRYRYRYEGPGPGGPYGPDRPAMVARMRYARGEISREQYDQIMTDLERRRGPP